jgi:hypothetical protein
MTVPMRSFASTEMSPTAQPRVVCVRFDHVKGLAMRDISSPRPFKVQSWLSTESSKALSVNNIYGELAVCYKRRRCVVRVSYLGVPVDARFLKRGTRFIYSTSLS